MTNRSRQSPTRNQRTLVESIDRYQLYSELEPLILSALKYGSIDQLISKSKSIATVELLKIMATADKDETKLKAVQEILNRSLGKPVERKVSLYGDLESMNEADIDRQIKTLMKEVGPSDVVDVIAEIGAKRLEAKRPLKESDVIGESASEGGTSQTPES